MADAAGVAAVVLAAGQSRRMGRPKLLLPWGDTTVLGETLRQTCAARARPIVVVTGHSAEAVAAIAQAAGCQSVYNPDHAAGEMLSSLQVGLRALPPETRGALVILADQPLVTDAILNSLIEAFEQGRGAIIAPIFDGQMGNPVLIGQQFWPELLAAPIGSRPRAVLTAHPEAVCYLPAASEAVLCDLDDPETYRRLRPPQPRN